MTTSLSNAMSDTPETDKNEGCFGWDDAFIPLRGTGGAVPVDFARKLERERDEARRLAEQYRDHSCETQAEADETLLPWEKSQ